MSKGNEDQAAKLMLWSAIYDEVKPYEYWPNDATTIAHNLCQWRATKSYYYINEVKNHLLKHSIKLTPTVKILLAEGDEYLMTKRTIGEPATAKKYAKLESIYCFMANLMYRREDMPLSLAALYAATECSGQYNAATLQKKYKAEFAGSAVEQDLYMHIEKHVPNHYEMWTKAIDERAPDSKLKGTRR